MLIWPLFITSTVTSPSSAMSYLACYHRFPSGFLFSLFLPSVCPPCQFKKQKNVIHLLKTLQWLSNRLVVSSECFTMASNIHTICDLAPSCLFGLISCHSLPLSCSSSRPGLLSVPLSCQAHFHLGPFARYVLPIDLHVAFSFIHPGLLRMLPSYLAPLSEVTPLPHVTPHFLTLFFYGVVHYYWILF